MRNASFSPHRILAIAGMVAIATLVLAGTLSAATGPGHYTRAQAASGASVYSAKCSQCHGVNLEGQSGPPLVGAAFTAYVGKTCCGMSWLFSVVKARSSRPAPTPSA